MRSKVRWVPAKTVLGQNQFITETLRAPSESAPTEVPPVDSNIVPTGLIDGGVILAGLGLAWMLTRKA